MSRRKVMEPFARYVLLDRLGRGGMTEVFRALTAVDDDSGGRVVTLKRVLPELLDAAAPETRARFLERFRVETTSGMRLSHPNVAQIYDFGPDGAAGQAGELPPFIAMEYVEGKSLRELQRAFVERRQPFPLAFALAITVRMARGLVHAHRQGVVHREVNPKCALIARDGETKLIDFAVARLEGVAAQGQLAFRAPEHLAGREPDARSDIFGVGAVLWELVTGVSPAERRVEGAADLIRERRPEASIGVQRALDALIATALSPNPTDRHPSAELLERELARILAEVSPGFGAHESAGIVRELLGEKYFDEEEAWVRSLMIEGRPIALRNRPTPPPPPGDSTQILTRDGVAPPALPLAPVAPPPAPREITGSQRRPTRAGGDFSYGGGSQPSIRIETPVVTGAIANGAPDPASTTGPRGPLQLAKMPGGVQRELRKAATGAVGRPERARGGGSGMSGWFSLLSSVIGGIYLWNPAAFQPLRPFLPEPLAKLIPAPSAPAVAASAPGPDRFPAGAAGTRTPSPAGPLRLCVTPTGAGVRWTLTPAAPAAIAVDAEGCATVPGDAEARLEISARGFAPQIRTLAAWRTQPRTTLVPEPGAGGVIRIRTTPHAPGNLRSAGGDLVWNFTSPTPDDGLQLPAGEYQLSVRHELLSLGVTQVVKIEAGRLTPLDLTLTPLESAR